MLFKDKIRYLRTENKMVQGDLAKKLGVSISAVSGWERGANRPQIDKISAISVIFDVPLGYFFADEEFSRGATVAISILGEIACGEPITAEENVMGYRDRALANMPSGKLFYLRAKGDSMERF